MYTDNNKVDGGDGIQKPIEFHLPKYKIPQLPPYKAFMYLSHLIMLVDIPVSNDDKKREEKKLFSRPYWSIHIVNVNIRTNFEAEIRHLVTVRHTWNPDPFLY